MYGRVEIIFSAIVQKHVPPNYGNDNNIIYTVQLESFNFIYIDSVNNVILVTAFI